MVRARGSWIVFGMVLLLTSTSHEHESRAESRAEAPVAGLVQKVQQRYDATTDFTADVTQEMTVASLGKTLTAHGTLSYKRPGKLRWQLGDGNGQEIVADGDTLWLYQPAEKQVLKAPFQSAFKASTPISFLLGVGRISDDFDASLDESAAPPTELTWLKLIPRQGDGTLGWLRLGVAPKTFDIAAAEIHDQLGNVTSLRFTNLKRGVGLADNLFHFQVPEGVDVVAAPIGF
ncbi:MAG: outer membrane lipoprotein carrier protein LolA [Deltaproteobacteria bacterium]|nr:outer membrane lipoprotein carrier protein LolA [Deltaproteobacteria bacterium]MBI3390576.1 outer membrane lipoprotein carrier protein LolA [Deltaproteobacteria bacterium]